MIKNYFYIFNHFQAAKITLYGSYNYETPSLQD